jgi:hypothetical protein
MEKIMETRNANTRSFALIGALCLVACAGCGSSQMCTGEMTVAGQTYQGSSEYAEQAIENTCNKYCVEGDPAFDSMYREWLQTPAGKKIDKPGKWWAMAEDNVLANQVAGCTANCMQRYRAGEQLIGVECK